MFLQFQKKMENSQEKISNQNTNRKKPKISFIKDILTSLRKGKNFYQDKPFGSGDSWLITELAAQKESQAPLVILASSPLDEKRFLEELSIFSPELRIGNFPDWETLPYDEFSPTQDLVSQRLSILHSLITQQIDVLVMSIYAALQRIAPPDFLIKHTFYFKQGDYLNEKKFWNQLISLNYNQVTRVSKPGEFCFRGGIIDLFPLGVKQPYRLDLFDNEIESIRIFSADTQLSLSKTKEIKLFPSHEFPMDEKSKTLFLRNFQEEFGVSMSNSAICKKVNQGIHFHGMEYYLPLFFKKTSSIFEYLNDDSLFLTIGDIDGSIRTYLKNTVMDRFLFIKKDSERKILDPKKLFLDSEELFLHLKKFSRLTISEKKTSMNFSKGPDVSILQKNKDPLFNLRNFLKNEANRVLLCSDSIGRLKTLLRMLNSNGLKPNSEFCSFEDFYNSDENFAILVAPLDAGFYFHEKKLLIVTENDLYLLNKKIKSQAVNSFKKSNALDLMLRDLTELNLGDPVVHKNYGIGRYRGLIEIEDPNSGLAEFLHLEYADEATLYVPVTKLYLISRYKGVDLESIPISRLGSNQWEKSYKKAKENIQDVAADLLKLYAERSSKKGYSFLVPKKDYEDFSDGLNFQETPDQLKAINEVISDMRSEKPMDRLICGDVGFGKTEIALRASFIAASNNKQVALLCPTTLLSEQHTQIFLERFSEYPMRVAEISRFRTNKELSETLSDIEKGNVNIVIGTHKILSNKVQFKNLGLIIIDEEHRFGVHQKEQLKKNICKEVDILTLTATPIPRTLSMSLEGMKDLSVIATPPEKRLAVKVFVRSEDRSIIKEALLREFKRGGQAYFLHNSVETIYLRKTFLEELIPEARIAVAHGKMKERDLEKVMKEFYQNHYNLLLCTTIIETGIDVPNANTIMVHRSDRFGLAQLHQLRGRVGRSYRQAYAYLMIPEMDTLTKNAKKRLEAIQLLSKLGSGFELAIHDLEIRGTGNILGNSQSGNIQEIGFSLYNEMLSEAVAILKNTGKSSDKGIENLLKDPLVCEINLYRAALLPSYYCSDIPSRIAIYNQLSSAKSLTDLDMIKGELIDRFGLLPNPVKTLFSSHEIRISAQSIGIKKVDASENRLLFCFGKNSLVDPKKIIRLVQLNSSIKLIGPNELCCDRKIQDVEDRIDVIFEMLELIKTCLFQTIN